MMTQTQTRRVDQMMTYFEEGNNSAFLIVLFSFTYFLIGVKVMWTHLLIKYEYSSKVALLCEDICMFLYVIYIERERERSLYFMEFIDTRS